MEEGKLMCAFLVGGYGILLILCVLYSYHLRENHKKEIEEGDHHDPSYLELFCDQNPSEPECLVYDD